MYFGKCILSDNFEIMVRIMRDPIQSKRNSIDFFMRQ